MRVKALLVAAFAAALALPAFAQSPQGGPPQGTPTNVRGTIAKLDGQILTVKSSDGSTVTVTLAPNYRVSTLARKKLSDIHAGDFVGTTSVPGKDGKLHAVEIHIFPEALRGVGEGQYPWDSRPNSLMTNATVSGVAKAPHGQILSVTYKNGTAEVIVGPKTPIVEPVPGTPQDLKRGKTVILFARKAADGTLGAGLVTVEKNGVKPPM
jgi:hypothetical protein